MKKRLKIGNRTIGEGYPAYIVAEIGINHNGDMVLAKETIDAAVESGVDAVKFQNYVTEDFISDPKLTYSYVSQGREVEESQYDMFKRCELSDNDLADLVMYCQKVGVDVHSTPTNKDGIQQLVELGVDVLKNGSDYLVNLPLIQEMGKTGLPTVLSTGMALIGEIDEAVRTFRETGNENLILLHCTSNYPTLAKDVNIRRIETLRRSFGCLSGFSDHTSGATAAVLSVSQKACWIEKHFTLDKNLAGPDHSFSLNPSELSEYIKSIREAELMGGTVDIRPTKTEISSRKNFRLSCVAAKNLAQNHVIQAEDIVYRRPGNGIRPVDSRFIIGMKLTQSVGKYEQLSSKHFM